MNRINVEFFETYKKLDRLCAQMYGLSGGGVTAYIDDMKDNWAAAYGTTGMKHLIHCAGCAICATKWHMTREHLTF